MSRSWLIYGPEPRGSKWRIRFRAPAGTWGSRTFASEAAAGEYRQALASQLEKEDWFHRAAQLYAEADKALAQAQALEGGKRTVSAAMDAYEHYLRFDKQNKESSIETTLYRFRALLAGELREIPIIAFTKRRAAEAYRARVDAGVSAATHRGELRAARTLWRWLIKRGWAAANPWVDIEPVGRVQRGKEQLRAHEARTFYAAALRQAEGIDVGRGRLARTRQEGAQAALCALKLGLRAGEIVGLAVRDVGAGELCVTEGKTANAARRVKVPEPLVRLLEDRARTVRGRGGDRLFDHRPGWVRDHTQRLCRVAGVPEVCAHSLRGLHATLATEAGATGEAVAAQLGHASPEITRTHYTRPEATAGARQRVVLQVLEGGR
jgi:integrase